MGFDSVRDDIDDTMNDRSQLSAFFGPPCTRIARIRAVLDAGSFSTQGATKRAAMCSSACKSVEDVLNDLGHAKRLQTEIARAAEAITSRRRALDDKVPVETDGSRDAREVTVVPDAVEATPAVTSRGQLPCDSCKSSGRRGIFGFRGLGLIPIPCQDCRERRRGQAAIASFEVSQTYREQPPPTNSQLAHEGAIGFRM